MRLRDFLIPVTFCFDWAQWPVEMSVVKTSNGAGAYLYENGNELPW